MPFYFFYEGAGILVMDSEKLSIISAIKYKSAIIKMCLIGIICYFVNLWWLDALQTLKFAYIIIAIFWAYVLTRQSEKEENINAAE